MIKPKLCQIEFAGRPYLLKKLDGSMGTAIAPADLWRCAGPEVTDVCCFGPTAEGAYKLWASMQGFVTPDWIKQNFVKTC